MEYQTLIARGDGLFSNVYSVLGALDWCAEHGKRLAVRFDSGPYLDSSRGPNWWEYFFERLSDIDPMELAVESRTAAEAFSVEMATRVIRNRQRASELIDSNLVLKPTVTQGLDDFWSAAFGGRFAIGLHLRGTDKFQEYPRPPLQEVFGAVERLTKGRSIGSWRIFLATDDAAYLEEAVRHFGDQVVFQRAIRSRTGHALHRQVDKVDWALGPHGNQPYPTMVTQPPYTIGLEAIRDALLLARSDVLLAALSNLSIFAAAYDPDILCIQTEIDASLTQFAKIVAFYSERINRLSAEQQRLRVLLARSSSPARRVMERLRRSLRKRIGGTIP